MVKYLIGPSLFFTLFILTSCGVKTHSIQFGKTTVTHLIAQKGAPIKEEEIPVAESKVLHFEEGEKYQIKGEVVVVGYKIPVGEEKKLIFWQHRFKECETSLRKVSGEEVEFACAAQGVSVIYSEGSEFVSSVVEYETK